MAGWCVIIIIFIIIIIIISHAERLKTKLLEEDRMVDIVAGPDAYRDLPRMLAAVNSTSATSTPSSQQSDTNTQARLSMSA